MKKFKFISGDGKVEVSLTAIEKKFESYLQFKACTAEGIAWLNGFKQGRTQTIALVMHFLYDKEWCDRLVEEQEEELTHLLSLVKVKIFKQLLLHVDYP